MTARRRRFAMQVLAVIVSIVFGAGGGMAKGGNRGGGGGGHKGDSHRGSGGNRKSVNKGGPASRGMGAAKRAQTKPQGRPGGGDHASNRPGGGGAGDRPKPGRDHSDHGDNVQARQDGRTERQDNRQDGRTDRTDNRQDHRSDRQEDRQHFIGNQIEEVDWNEIDWDEYEVHDHFEWGLGTWMALTIGTAVTVNAWNTMTQQAGCNLQQTEVNGQKYMKCGNTWYIEAWSGDQVHYVAVESPV